MEGPSRLPIRALTFLSSSRLVAVSGGHLEFYNIDGEERCADTLLISRQHAVSGVLVIDESTLIAWAGRCMFRVEGRDLEGEERYVVKGTKILADKIITVERLRDSLVAAILSHGQAVILDPTHLSIDGTHYLGEDYLIYSACILGDFEGEGVLLAYGSVFHGIEIFQLDREHPSPLLIAKLDGHEGSIFDLAHHAATSLLASASDDRTIRLWDLSPLIRSSRNGSPAVLKASKCLVGHKSRVWRVAWYNSWIVSAAEDATIRLWNTDGDCMRLLKGHEGLNIWALAVDPIRKRLVSGGDDCSIRLWNLRDTDQLDVRTVHYPLLKAEPKWLRFKGAELITLLSDGTFRGFDSKIKVSSISRNAIFDYDQASGLLVVGALDGSLHIQWEGLVRRVETGFTSRIAHIRIQTDDDHVSGRILVQAGNGAASVATFEIAGLVIVASPIQVRGTITCSLWVSKDRCFIGTRDGRILLYDHSIETVVTLGFHSEDAITCLKRHPTDHMALLMTDRSGHLTLSKIAETTELGLNLSAIWKARVTKSWLEQVDVEGDGSIYVSGFESTEFFVLHFPSRREVLRATTGGAHRFWHLRLLDGIALLAFIRLGTVYVVRRGLGVIYDSICIREALHGAEIRALCAPSEGHILSACEEGKIVQINATHGHLSIKGFTKAHNSGIKSLAALDGFVFAAGSAEALTAWKLNRDDHHSLTFLSSTPKTPKVTEVRIMDVALTVDEETPNTITVASALSDSSVGLWTFHQTFHQFQRLANLPDAHQGHCTLKVQFVKLNCPSSGLSQISVLSAGTDGYLCVHSLGGRLLSRLRAHQSGINALAVDPTTLFVATGGDDGRVAVAQIAPLGELSLVASINEAHSSTVTGLAWMGEGKLVSASIDQRVMRWSLHDETLSLLSVESTHVADAYAILPLPGGLLIAGSGMHLHPLPDPLIES